VSTETVESKKCTGPCGLVKPLTEFYRDRRKSDGHTSRCKGCRSVPNRDCLQLPD
jgi:hypothetical protein